jgi:ADP-ribosylation factor GTPase-activating protein 2/3
MKVGGNANAAEHFRRNNAAGFGFNSQCADAKTKYTSKAAVTYKQKLAQLSNEDVKR